MINKTGLAALIVLIVLVAGVLHLNTSFSKPAGDKNQKVLFIIEPGQGVNQVSQVLYDQGLIKSKLIFEFYVWFKRSEGKLLAGSHNLNIKMNVKEVLAILISGDSVDNERVITIIEGLGADEVAKYLADRGLVSEEEFFSAMEIKKWRSEYDFAKDIPWENIEGFMFPDTYRIFVNATAKNIIEKMLDNFNLRLTEEMRQDIVSSGRSIYEVINLASIVEKEARTVQDKKMVAGIFLNRLETGMALQSDATVNYVTSKSLRRPTYADLEIDSPYNTYKYRGLPPGPIANPGLGAIEAVIYPTESDYLYFLMDLDGNAYYARDFAGHQENIRRYLD